MKKKILTTEEVRQLLIRECAKTSIYAWARTNGESRARVSEVINGIRNPSKRICEALGLERVYRRK